MKVLLNIYDWIVMPDKTGDQRFISWIIRLLVLDGVAITIAQVSMYLRGK